MGRHPCCGMQMLNVDLYAAKHKAAEQQSQNKKLCSDSAISAFRCDRSNTPCTSSMGAH